MGGVHKIGIGPSWTHVGGQIGPKSGNWAISLKMQLFSKTEKPHFETSSGLQDKSNYWYFTKKSPKKVVADPILAHSVKFTKLAKMAIFGWKLEKFENFFFSKLALIYDYYMVIIPNFAQTNPCAAFGVDSQDSWFSPISDFQQTPTCAALFLTPDPNRWWFWDHHRWGFSPRNQTGMSWKMGDPLFE